MYVPGLTDRTGSKERAGISAEADAAGYNKRQTQRYMERTVRKWKRRQAAAITPEDERMARAYVVKWQGKLRELTGGTTLPRKDDREGGRVKLSDAAKKAAEAILSKGERVELVPVKDGVRVYELKRREIKTPASKR